MFSNRNDKLVIVFVNMFRRHLQAKTAANRLPVSRPLDPCCQCLMYTGAKKKKSSQTKDMFNFDPVCPVVKDNATTASFPLHLSNQKTKFFREQLGEQMSKVPVLYANVPRNAQTIIRSKKS